MYYELNFTDNWFHRNLSLKCKTSKPLALLELWTQHLFHHIYVWSIAPAIISLAHFLPKHSWIVRDMCDFLLFCDCAWILWSILLQSFIFCILSTKVKVNKNRISKGKVERIEYFEILRQYLYPLHFFPQKSQGEQFHCWVFRKMKMYIHTESCMWMFLIVSSVTFQNWKPPKCPLFSEWRNKLWYILTVEYYSAILENEL